MEPDPGPCMCVCVSEHIGRQMCQEILSGKCVRKYDQVTMSGNNVREYDQVKETTESPGASNAVRSQVYVYVTKDQNGFVVSK